MSPVLWRANKQGSKQKGSLLFTPSQGHYLYTRDSTDSSKPRSTTEIVEVVVKGTGGKTWPEDRVKVEGNLYCITSENGGGRATGSFSRVRKKQAVTSNYSLEKANPIKLIDFKSNTTDNRTISRQVVGFRSWAWPKKEHRAIAVIPGVLLSTPKCCVSLRASIRHLMQCVCGGGGFKIIIQLVTNKQTSKLQKGPEGRAFWQNISHDRKKQPQNSEAVWHTCWAFPSKQREKNTATVTRWWI